MNDPEKIAAQVCKTYKTCDFSVEDLIRVAEDQGFKVVFFNALANDADVTTLLQSLNLTAYAAERRGFTFADESFRIIFIHEDLSKSEKRVVLAHELGHVFCEHFGHAQIIGNDVTEEEEANAFAVALLYPGAFRRALTAIRRRRILFVLLLVAVAAAAGVLIYSLRHTNEQQFHGEFYITATGGKYHVKSCRYVKNKSNAARLTEKQYASGKFVPCEVCNPEQSPASQ